MSNNRPMSRAGAWTAGILATLLAVPAAAQVLDEIIVTAQKKEQAIQDVGITINAFSGEQMKALNIQDSVDVARFAPGVHISGALAGLNSQFTIRGVTQTDFNDIVEAPNAVYLDEGYIPVAQAQTFALFDVERVETTDFEQEVDDWIARADQDPADADEARRMMAAAVGTRRLGGRRVRRDEAGRVIFTVRWAIVVATPWTC